MPAKVKLYMFPGSNSVYTGRLMLEHKGIDYRTVTLMPGAHAFIMLGLGFPTMGVPALKIDGRRVQGTRPMARVLDELFPDAPALFPTDPARRKAVQAAERWGEEFQNATRRIFYCGARRDRTAFASVMTPGRMLPMRAVMRMSAPIVVRLATGAHRATDDAGREDLELLPERLDQIDAWLADGLLGGDALNAADFQIAVNVAALMLFDDLRPFIEDRAAAAYAQRVAPDYVGHLGAVLPSEWLEPLREAGAARTASGRGVASDSPAMAAAGEADTTAPPGGEADTTAPPGGEADTTARPAGGADAAARTAGEADTTARPGGEAVASRPGGAAAPATAPPTVPVA